MRLLFVTALLIFNSIICEAEVGLCNGVWTNGPCDVKAAKSFVEQPLDPRATDKDYQARMSFLRFVSQYQEDMKQKGVDVPYRDFETFCMKKAKSVDECRAMLNDLAPMFRQQADENAKQREKDDLYSRIASAENAADRARIAAERAHLSVGAGWPGSAAHGASHWP